FESIGLKQVKTYIQSGNIVPPHSKMNLSIESVFPLIFLGYLF
ncbi:DUF1697 domain-containing protein, partial [Bacillus sp. HC-Mk]